MRIVKTLLLFGVIFFLPSLGFSQADALMPKKSTVSKKGKETLEKKEVSEKNAKQKGTMDIKKAVSTKSLKGEVERKVSTSPKKNQFNSAVASKKSNPAQLKVKGIDAVKLDFPNVSDVALLKKLSALRYSDLTKYNEYKKLMKGSSSKRRR